MIEKVAGADAPEMVDVEGDGDGEKRVRAAGGTKKRSANRGGTPARRQ